MSVLETDRLWIFPLRPDDAEDYLELVRTPEVRAYLSQDTDGVTADELKRFLALGDVEGFTFAIKARANGKLIGVCGRSRTQVISGWPDINVFIHPAVWRQGFAREALNQFIRFLFVDMGVPGVSARVKNSNHASHRLMESIAMSPVQATMGMAETIYCMNRERYLSEVI